ncbi:MAG: hypothetical protein CMI54_00745 [Parcubacteria group bacterium]|nr:hypothetical protein [Parcubacteria group bacterium]
MATTSQPGAGATPFQSIAAKEATIGNETVTTSTIQNLTVSNTLTRNNITFQYPFRTGTEGATGGFDDANDTGTATVPASQTGSTFCVPITGLKQGDILQSFFLSGQLESAGNTATIDVSLRATTAAAADLTDASVQAMTQVSKTADYLVAETTNVAGGHTVIAGESLYFLVTVTTAANTDVDLQYISLTVNQV